MKRNLSLFVNVKCGIIWEATGPCCLCKMKKKAVPFLCLVCNIMKSNLPLLSMLKQPVSFVFAKCCKLWKSTYPFYSVICSIHVLWKAYCLLYDAESVLLWENPFVYVKLVPFVLYCEKHCFLLGCKMWYIMRSN